MQPDTVKRTIKALLMEEFLPGIDESELDDETPLISGGVLDSISTVKFISILERRFGVKFEAYEMTVDHLDTLPLITDTVLGKVQDTSRLPIQP
ncbi:MAG: acyl carrier protein [Rhodothermales bacterium]|nr:acyl carrier protein [Rhodothermales bacterium]